MKAYPIWNNVHNCSYKSSKSYGNKNTGEVNVLVGSSYKNSHELITHYTTKRFNDNNEIVFRFGVELPNGHKLILAEKVFKNNDGIAGELIRTRYIRSNVKGL